MTTALAKLAYSRRMTSRIETMGDVWVYWGCQGVDDVSRVCDLSLGGLFLFTPVFPPPGAKTKLDFLVQEGQIRAEAIVRHLVPGGGIGLKFTAINDKDCPQLVSLLNRIRTCHLLRRSLHSRRTVPVARPMLLRALKVKDVPDNIGPAI